MYKRQDILKVEEGGFMGYIRGEDRNQMILFPESIDDYISEDSVVRVIEAYVDCLLYTSRCV